MRASVRARACIGGGSGPGGWLQARVGIEVCNDAGDARDDVPCSRRPVSVAQYTPALGSPIPRQVAACCAVVQHAVLRSLTVRARKHCGLEDQCRALAFAVPRLAPHAAPSAHTHAHARMRAHTHTRPHVPMHCSSSLTHLAPPSRHESAVQEHYGGAWLRRASPSPGQRTAVQRAQRSKERWIQSIGLSGCWG